MRSEFLSSGAFLELRKQAEKLLIEKGNKKPDIEKDAFLQLVHELEVYQVELELQNEELRSAKAELETSRDELFDLYESAPVAYVTLNEKGIVERVNRAAFQMLNSYQELRPGSVFLTWVYPQDIRIYSSLLEDLAKRGTSAPVELRLKGKKSEPLFAHVESSAKTGGKGRDTLWRLAFVDITQRKLAERRLEELTRDLEAGVRDRTAELSRRTEQLSRLSSRLTLAEQKERSRIAGVLHDHVQQLMVGAKMGQELLIPSLHESLRQEAEHVLDLVKRSIHAMRSLSAELSPPILQSGDLVAALQWLARWMLENHGFEVALKIETEKSYYQKDVTVLVFQSVRELLFNVVKHADVKSAAVEVEWGNGALRVQLSDRGAGFDPETALEDAGYGRKFGLIGIRERMAYLGGSLEIKSAPQAGAAISMLIPLDKVKALKETQAERVRETREERIPERAGKPEIADKLRVLLVDDHPVILDGLSKMLGSYPDIDLVGQASDGEEAVDLARKIVPDVILMDINMPKMNGIEATRIIHSEFPHIRIIALSAYDEKELAIAMLDAGASAYKSKTDTRDLLLAAIRGGGES